MRWLTPDIRRWLYGISSAGMPLLITYGTLTDTQAALWLALVGAVLIPGVALANTPSPRRALTDDSGSDG